LSKAKEIKGLRGGIRWYAAQAIPPIDAEIGQKDHLWMETNYQLFAMQLLRNVDFLYQGR